jgi:hypothetical protein
MELQFLPVGAWCMEMPALAVQQWCMLSDRS